MPVRSMSSASHEESLALHLSKLVSDSKSDIIDLDYTLSEARASKTTYLRYINI